MNLEDAQWRIQDASFQPGSWDRSFLRPPDSVSPSLEHVFTQLAIEHGRELIASALVGIGAEDNNLRGTALEFLESVIPTARCQCLFDRIQAQATTASARSREEIEENLLLSAVSLMSDSDSR